MTIMDHSYSTDSRDTYQSKDHSYFRYGRKATPIIHPRAYDPESGRKDHSYFKLTPLAVAIVSRADAGPDHTYGYMKGERKPLRDAKQRANMQTAAPHPKLWGDPCVHLSKSSEEEEVVVDVDPVQLEKEVAEQIVKDHTYTYSTRKTARRTVQEGCSSQDPAQESQRVAQASV